MSLFKSSFSIGINDQCYLFMNLRIYVTFLGKIGKVVKDLENDFKDGVHLLLLIGLLDGKMYLILNFAKFEVLLKNTRKMKSRN